jgi:hypothetical protein
MLSIAATASAAIVFSGLRAAQTLSSGLAHLCWLFAVLAVDPGRTPPGVVARLVFQLVGIAVLLGRELVQRGHLAWALVASVAFGLVCGALVLAAPLYGHQHPSPKLCKWLARVFHAVLWLYGAVFVLPAMMAGDEALATGLLVTALAVPYSNVGTIQYR